MLWNGEVPFMLWRDQPHVSRQDFKGGEFDLTPYFISPGEGNSEIG